MIARAGITRIDSDRHFEIQIAKFVGHPGYKSPKVYYDLALAKLAQKITFNQRIQAICLPTEPVGENELVTVQGWGRSSEGYKGELTEINVAARSVHNLNIICVTITLYRSNAFCNYKYGVLNMTEALDGPFIINLTMPELLPPQMYCTDGNVNGVIGTCYGDSGGPHIKKYVWKG